MTEGIVTTTITTEPSDYMNGTLVSGMTNPSFDNTFIPVVITTIEDFVKGIDDVMLEDAKKKFADVIDTHFPKTPINEQVYIISFCYNLIKDKYNAYDSLFKSWLVHIIRKLYELKVITLSSEIEQYIDKYLVFYNENYIQYIDNIEMFCSEYDRDIAFINQFIKIQRASNGVFTT